MHASNKNPPLVDVSQAVTEILAKRKQVPSQRSLLIGVSGIDGCGKGYLTDKIVAQLQLQGQKTVGINVDGWLNLPHQRFNPDRPAEHFYEHAIRFDEMFIRLILPFQEKRRHDLVADFSEEVAK